MTYRVSRRHFLASASAAASLPILTAGCNNEPMPTPGSDRPASPEPEPPADDQPETPTGWGDLTGRIVYDGPAPERKKLTVDKDVDCCGKFDIRDESLMVGPDGGLANVFIYLAERDPAIHPEVEAAVPEEVLLDNLDCIFQPHCMTIWAQKQTYHIVNSDPVAQNVAFSPPFDKSANIVLPVDGEATWNFRRGQRLPVAIACNYHPWESAYILPTDHPYVAITGPDGTFTIPNLPAGKHEFQIWHERPGELETADWPKGKLTIDIQPGANDLGEIRLSPALFASPGEEEAK